MHFTFQIPATDRRCAEPLPHIADKIYKPSLTIPPATAVKGGMIPSGVNEELDELRNISQSGKSYLTKLQQIEAEKTGISSLKISFNNVFGYYLEVTNVHKTKCLKTGYANRHTPMQKGTSPRAERIWGKISRRRRKILALEQQLYDLLLNELFDYLCSVQTNGNLEAILDCLCCFAHNAIHYQYKTSASRRRRMAGKGSAPPRNRKKSAPGESYISNDLELNKTDQQIIILTGPNMSGKVGIAKGKQRWLPWWHIGSFVPANEARIGLTDKIFTRGCFR